MFARKPKNKSNLWVLNPSNSVFPPAEKAVMRANSLLKSASSSKKNAAAGNASTPSIQRHGASSRPTAAAQGAPNCPSRSAEVLCWQAQNLPLIT